MSKKMDLKRIKNLLGNNIELIFSELGIEFEKMVKISPAPVQYMAVVAQTVFLIQQIKTSGVAGQEDVRTNSLMT